MTGGATPKEEEEAWADDRGCRSSGVKTAGMAADKAAQQGRWKSKKVRGTPQDLDLAKPQLKFTIPVDNRSGQSPNEHIILPFCAHFRCFTQAQMSTFVSLPP